MDLLSSLISTYVKSAKIDCHCLRPPWSQPEDASSDADFAKLITKKTQKANGKKDPENLYYQILIPTIN